MSKITRFPTLESLSHTLLVKFISVSGVYSSSESTPTDDTENSFYWDFGRSKMDVRLVTNSYGKVYIKSVGEVEVFNVYLEAEVQISNGSDIPLDLVRKVLEAVEEANKEGSIAELVIRSAIDIGRDALQVQLLQLLAKVVPLKGKTRIRAVNLPLLEGQSCIYQGNRYWINPSENGMVEIQLV